jgi:hypothetical protein
MNYTFAVLDFFIKLSGLEVQSVRFLTFVLKTSIARFHKLYSLAFVTCLIASGIRMFAKPCEIAI